MFWQLITKSLQCNIQRKHRQYTIDITIKIFIKVTFSKFLRSKVVGRKIKLPQCKSKAEIIRGKIHKIWNTANLWIFLQCSIKYQAKKNNYGDPGVKEQPL